MISQVFFTKAKPRRHDGFTLVELVGVLIIVGVLAAVVIPRFFDQRAMDARTFADQVQSMLRYAQKLAISQNFSPVFVRLNGGSIALCYDANCTQPVRPPSKENSGSAATLAACSNNRQWFCEAPPAGITYVADPATPFTFSFDASGKPFTYNAAATSPSSAFTQALTITITGDGMSRQIIVERETGHVHRP